HGARRLEAYRHLGREWVPFVCLDTLADRYAYLQAEGDENTCRKDFTPSEAVELGRELEKLEATEAAKRKAEGQKTGGRGHKKNSAASCGQVSAKHTNAV